MTNVIGKLTNGGTDHQGPSAATREVERWFVCWSLLIGLGAVLGVVPGLADLGTRGDLIIDTLRRGCRHLGIIGLALTAGTLMVGRWRQWPGLEQRVGRVNGVWARCLLAAVVSFVTAEVFLRLVFFNGASFGSGAGPITARFARSFQLNQFGSRGPDAIGPKPAGRFRIMVQGDSLTFGHGVQGESNLYTSLMLESLQRLAPGRFDMSVHAKSGENITDHLDTLRRMGPAVAPDVIIYQWYPNDLETDAAPRPVEFRRRIWTKLFFHELFQQVSYAWWFVDRQLTMRLSSPKVGYRERFHEIFAESAPGWAAFEARFREWADTGRSLCPRVAVLLYPSKGQGIFQDIHGRVIRLASAHGIRTVDMTDYVGDTTDPRYLYAGRLDDHPSVFMHRRMAEVLLGELPVWWPELFRSEHATGADSLMEQTRRP